MKIFILMFCVTSILNFAVTKNEFTINKIIGYIICLIFSILCTLCVQFPF